MEPELFKGVVSGVLPFPVPLQRPRRSLPMGSSMSIPWMASHLVDVKIAEGIQGHAAGCAASQILPLVGLVETRRTSLRPAPVVVIIDPSLGGVTLRTLVVEHVGDVQVARGVDRQPSRIAQIRFGRRAIVTEKAGSMERLHLPSLPHRS